MAVSRMLIKMTRSSNKLGARALAVIGSRSHVRIRLGLGLDVTMHNKGVARRRRRRVAPHRVNRRQWMVLMSKIVDLNQTDDQRIV